MELLEALKWRYATKRMTGEKISAEKADRIMEAIRLTPSSMGLQPYSVVVVQNREVLKELQPIINNQPQVPNASHLLVFAAWTSVTEKHIDDYLENIHSIRGTAREDLKRQEERLKQWIADQPADKIQRWAEDQTFIALGTAITAAAVEKVDATPMGGFNAQALDEYLKLNEKGLHSVVLLALGYRDESNDYLVKQKKVRRNRAQLFETI
jgi:nitroreductase/dihydropteridine reductase